MAPRPFVRAPQPIRVDADGAVADGAVDDGDRCPHCKVSLLGAPIAADKQHLYGDATHFRREVHVTPERGSGVMFYVCPECHGAWAPSFENATGTGADERADRSTAAMAEHRDNVAHLADRTRLTQVLTEHREIIVFALGLDGYRWTGWAVAPQIGSYLYLLTTPVLDSSRGPSSHAIRLIGTATGLPERLISVLTEQSPMARNMRESDPGAVHPPPPGAY